MHTLAAGGENLGPTVNRSLVNFEVGSAGIARYRLLDSVRSFAAARLNEAGSTDVAMRAYTEWFAAAAAVAALSDVPPEDLLDPSVFP